METAAKYFRAFQGFPEDTSHDTWRLFTEKERGGVYEDLFVEGLAPEVLKLAWLLGEQVRKSYPDWVGCEKKECTGENLHRFEILAQVLALAHRYRYDVALVGHILGSELGEVAAVDTARKAIETFEGNTCLPLTGADAYLNAAFHYMREFFDARLDTGDPDWSGKLRRRDTDRIFPQLKAFVDRQVRQLGKAWRSPACA